MRTSAALVVLTSLAMPAWSISKESGALSLEELNRLIDGPPAPQAPEVVNRDEGGRVTLRAVRLKEPMQLDGRLEERVYLDVPAISGFVQQEPSEGMPETETTEVWVFFDDANVYFSARLRDSEPDRMIANEMRRDNRGIFNNENFAVILDTFYDRRNGFLFQTNPLGALWDGQVTDEQNTNSDWNTVWHVKSARFPEGWTVEMAIPFKSLRYREGGTQIWGINFRRIVKWKNEWDYLTPIAAAFSRDGIQRLSAAATLVGIETPTRSMNLELKPYATGEDGHRPDARASARERPRFRFRLRREVRRHQEPDVRLHLSHRLRAGGGRRSPGEPHALRPVLPREAGVLPRGPGDLQLRSDRIRSVPRLFRYSDPVLQPPHRPYRRAGDSRSSPAAASPAAPVPTRSGS